MLLYQDMLDKHSIKALQVSHDGISNYHYLERRLVQLVGRGEDFSHVHPLSAEAAVAYYRNGDNTSEHNGDMMRIVEMLSISESIAEFASEFNENGGFLEVPFLDGKNAPLRVKLTDVMTSAIDLLNLNSAIALNKELQIEGNKHLYAIVLAFAHSALLWMRVMQPAILSHCFSYSAFLHNSDKDKKENKTQSAE